MFKKDKIQRIPKKISIGGQEISIDIVDKISGNCLGRCCLGGGFIQISNVFHEDIKQSDSSKRNTFFHEVVHAILGTMGEEKLDANEKFVSSFSSFLTEAMKNAVFIENEK